VISSFGLSGALRLRDIHPPLGTCSPFDCTSKANSQQRRCDLGMVDDELCTSEIEQG
jgi:hypothetical protein